ncbi:MAG: hypothetical protein K6F00_02285 [Lachnospiraceae bacterium]|nr:hypothetical protein [Lachnospiraceae bacterium]
MTKAFTNLFSLSGRIIYSIVGVAIVFIVFRFATSSYADVLLGIDSASIDPTAQAAVDQFCGVFSNALFELGRALFAGFREMMIQLLNMAAEALASM